MSNVTRMPNVSPQNWPQQNWSGSWPPSCSCGCNPCQCGGGWGGMSGLMQCWQDIAQFQQFLACMLSQMGPFPMQGVTDGSNAAPGNIGEFMTATANATFAAGVVTTTTLSPIVIPPGDWDLWSFSEQTVETGIVWYYASPQPVGVTNDMSGIAGAPGAGLLTRVIGLPARGSFTVPTLLAFHVEVHQDTVAGLLAGTLYLTVSGRRRR